VDVSGEEEVEARVVVVVVVVGRENRGKLEPGMGGPDITTRVLFHNGIGPAAVEDAIVVFIFAVVGGEVEVEGVVEGMG